MIKKFEKREVIQNKVQEICDRYLDTLKEYDKDENEKPLKVDRGVAKLMFMAVNEQYTSKTIVPKYCGIDLWNICVVGEIMMKICAKYNIIPNRVLLSVITGVSNYTLEKIENDNDYEVIDRMNAEYQRDYKLYFKEVYNNKKDRKMGDELNLTGNIEHAYPVYCLVQELREMEEDARVERSKLGDITKLNAPREIGGFGYAHPVITVDNRQLIIGDKEKLLSTYATAKKVKGQIEVDKKELQEEAIDLFEDIKNE